MKKTPLHIQIYMINVTDRFIQFSSQVFGAPSSKKRILSSCLCRLNIMLN